MTIYTHNESKARRMRRWIDLGRGVICEIAQAPAAGQTTEDIVSNF